MHRFPNHHVYNVVANVNDYKYFVPWCVDSRITKQTSPYFMEAQLAVGFQLFSERYTSEVTLEPQTKIIVHAKQTQLFHYLTNEWSFQPGPHPYQDTWLSFKVDFQFRSLLYAQASHLFFDEVVSKMVAAFERRCEITWDNKKYPQYPTTSTSSLPPSPPIFISSTVLSVPKVSIQKSNTSLSIASSTTTVTSTIPTSTIINNNHHTKAQSSTSSHNIKPLPSPSSPILHKENSKSANKNQQHKLPPPLKESVWL